jgi:hypothetical protein
MNNKTKLISIAIIATGVLFGAIVFSGVAHTSNEIYEGDSPLFSLRTEYAINENTGCSRAYLGEDQKSLIPIDRGVLNNNDYDPTPDSRATLIAIACNWDKASWKLWEQTCMFYTSCNTCIETSCDETCVYTCPCPTYEDTCWETCLWTCDCTLPTDCSTCEDTCINTWCETCITCETMDYNTCQETCPNTCDMTCSNTCDYYNTCHLTCPENCGNPTYCETCDYTCQQTCDLTCYTCP